MTISAQLIMPDPAIRDTAMPIPLSQPGGGGKPDGRSGRVVAIAVTPADKARPTSARIWFSSDVQGRPRPPHQHQQDYALHERERRPASRHERGDPGKCEDEDQIAGDLECGDAVALVGGL